MFDLIDRRLPIYAYNVHNSSADNFTNEIMKLYFFTGFYQDCKMERYQLLGYERNIYEISLHFTQANEKISGNCLVSLTALM